MSRRVKHTPEPWVAHSWGDHEVEILGEKSVICDMHQEYDKHGRGMNKHIEADANLITAAPELLSALKRAVEHAESHDDYDWIGAAMLAIKKAEGPLVT